MPRRKSTMDADTELSDTEIKFLDEWELCCFNGAEAARRIGISPGSARVWAAKTLAKANVKYEVTKRRADRRIRAKKNEETMLFHLAAMATATVDQYMDTGNEDEFLSDERGGEKVAAVMPYGRCKPLHSLTPEQRAGIVGWEATDRGFKIKLNKTKAIELYMRHLGMIEDGISQIGGVLLVPVMDPEKWEASAVPQQRKVQDLGQSDEPDA